MKDADKTDRAKPLRMESRGPKRTTAKPSFLVGMFVPGPNAVVRKLGMDTEITRILA